MRQEDFLVTTTIKNRSRKVVWNSSEPLILDHPPKWQLERSSAGIQIRGFGHNADQDIVGVTDIVQRGGKIRVPSPVPDERDRLVTISIQPLKPIKPAFHPTPSSTTLDDSKPGQLFLFWGTRFFMEGVTPLGQSFNGVVNEKPIFKLTKNSSGYTLTALCSGVKFKHPKENRKELSPKTPLIISDRQFWVGRIEYQKHWWRVNRVITPDPLKVELLEAREKQEARLFKQITLALGICFIMLMIGIHLLPRKESITKPADQTAVSIKLPKLIPAEDKKPEPPKPPAKKEPPPPPPKLEKQKPKAPQPKEVAKKPTPKPTAPPPPSIVQPPIVPKPDPAAEAAKAKAQLAQQLSFLSNSSQKPVATIKNDQATSRYNSAGNVDNIKDANSSALNQIAQSKKSDTPLETKNARNIKTDIQLSEKGKQLNEVQGKVSIGDLYDPNAPAGIGSTVGGKGIQLSGSGEISEAEVEKALSKHLVKFQYCYEKALLSDQSLGGLLQMQWVINESGKATSTQVLRSELNNQALHKCISDEILKVNFPTPRGGPVSIKYPFKFSSSSL